MNSVTVSRTHLLKYYLNTVALLVRCSLVEPLPCGRQHISSNKFLIQQTNNSSFSLSFFFTFHSDAETRKSLLLLLLPLQHSNAISITLCAALKVNQGFCTCALLWFRTLLRCWMRPRGIMPSKKTMKRPAELLLLLLA